MEIPSFAKSIFSPEIDFERPTQESGLPIVTFEKPVESSEGATVEILNGTFVNGLARANQEELKALGYEIIKIGNSESQDYEDTIVYDISNGKFPKTLDFLAANYTDNITASIPLGVSSVADILIILGLDKVF